MSETDHSEYMEEEEEWVWEEGEVSQDEEEIELDNLYHNGKNESDIKVAISYFKQVLEKGAPEWQLKALRRLCTLEYTQGNYATFNEHVAALLNVMSNCTAHSAIEKAAYQTTELGFAHPDFQVGAELCSRFASCLITSHKRVYVGVLLRWCRRCWVDKQLTALEATLDAILGVVGDLERHKSTEVELEVVAYQIQICLLRRNYPLLRDLCTRARKKMTSAFPHPRIAGFILDGFGKVAMLDKKWADAQVEFFEAYKLLVEGSEHTMKLKAVQYLLICAMLQCGSQLVVDPLDSVELRNFKELHDNNIARADEKDKETLKDTMLLVKLQYKFQNSDEEDLVSLSSVVNAVNVCPQLRADPFIAPNVGLLLRTAQIGFLQQAIKPYQGHAVRLSHLTKKLHCDIATVISLLTELIIDGQLLGLIDEVSEVLVLPTRTSNTSCTTDIPRRWADSLTLCSAHMTSCLA
eukprot:TRINITY_DN34690_c0_g1_i1.p1 TRINITY_DN34690_c0_g1~~TRINITY_DN34690_c0_g1_i1.p1  ORF type:complete len:465 (-),score=38.93 TRINITY_DN34690_c0_g1_i1:121-1515(-)